MTTERRDIRDTTNPDNPEVSTSPEDENIAGFRGLLREQLGLLGDERERVDPVAMTLLTREWIGQSPRKLSRLQNKAVLASGPTGIKGEELTIATSMYVYAPWVKKDALLPINLVISNEDRREETTFPARLSFTTQRQLFPLLSQITGLSLETRKDFQTTRTNSVDTPKGVHLSLETACYSEEARDYFRIMQRITAGPHFRYTATFALSPHLMDGKSEPIIGILWEDRSRHGRSLRRYYGYAKSEGLWIAGPEEELRPGEYGYWGSLIRETTGIQKEFFRALPQTLSLKGVGALLKRLPEGGCLLPGNYLQLV